MLCRPHTHGPRRGRRSRRHPKDGHAVLWECGDLSFLCDEYNEVLVNRDKEVCVLEPDHTYHAHAKGINALGELVVKTMEGEEKTVFAGEVSVRGIYGYV